MTQQVNTEVLQAAAILLQEAAEEAKEAHEAQTDIAERFIELSQECGYHGRNNSSAGRDSQSSLCENQAVVNYPLTERNSQTEKKHLFENLTSDEV